MNNQELGILLYTGDMSDVSYFKPYRYFLFKLSKFNYHSHTLAIPKAFYLISGQSH